MPTESRYPELSDIVGDEGTVSHLSLLIISPRSTPILGWSPIRCAAGLITDIQIFDYDICREAIYPDDDRWDALANWFQFANPNVFQNRSARGECIITIREPALDENGIDQSHLALPAHEIYEGQALDIHLARWHGWSPDRIARRPGRRSPPEDNPDDSPHAAEHRKVRRSPY